MTLAALQNQRLRVTAYYRVSTDKEDQQNSLINQEAYFNDLITNTPNWEFVPFYHDDGITGTSTKKRKGFNRMIADANVDRFDYILTKEVSRFARNTVDTLSYTRQLKDLGIGVVFLQDNIDSLDGKDEFRLTIMASVAQEESRKTSERVKFGHSKSMEKGVVYGRNKMLGYIKVKGVLAVDPLSAATVRSIFSKYLDEGKGAQVIANELQAEKVLTSSKTTSWDASTILRILTNEKYVGDLKQGKFITPNYLNHKSKRNKSEEGIYYLTNTHEPIIDRTRFNQVQEEIARRNRQKESGTRYTNRYPFSGKLICGSCGGTYESSNARNNGNIHYRRWRCATSRKKGTKAKAPDGCNNRMVRNEILEQVFLNALKDMVFNRQAVIDELSKILAKVLDTANITSECDAVETEINKLQKGIDRLIVAYADGTIAKDELRRSL
jgi:DNA invertase Pin-like site-specific DNA recombinase